MVEVTAGITAAIFSLMTRLAIAAIESDEERISTAELEGGGAMTTLWGEPV
jgi:hypothetical protein